MTALTLDDQGQDVQEAPGWFTAAVTTPAEVTQVEVDGVVVRARCWGERDRPGIVLVHGGGAHARWWDHIGPQLSQDHRVVAVDLSGHGDSDWRDDYSYSQWADEVLAQGSAAGIAGAPVFVGHSMGGYVSFAATMKAGGTAAGLVVIDSPLPVILPFHEQPAPDAPRPTARYYPSESAILARFRLTPLDEFTLPYVTRHVAKASVAEHPEGWKWKFDPLQRIDRELPSEDLAAAPCPVAVFRGDHGALTPEITAQMQSTQRPFPIVTVPDAGHHVLLDDPTALVVGLRTLLAMW